MSRVKGHWRNGVWVRPHNRRGRAAGISSVVVIAAIVWALFGSPHLARKIRTHTAAAHSTKSTPARSSTQTDAPAAAATESGQLTLIQEPEAGYQPIYRAFTDAKVSIDMTMYELADDQAQADLVAAHRRGVTVRVILDRAFHGQQVNQAAYDQLTAAGVAVHWAGAGQIVHQKSIVVDGKTAWISTGNLTSKYYASTRDAAIEDTNPTQVKAIAATFAADWASPDHSGNAVGATGLMWSPGAQQQIVADINTARKSVDFTSEELADTQVIAALSAAAKRGVACRVVMTDSLSWTTGFQQVTAAGCTVHVFPDSAKALYIHEKIIAIDHATVLIGSQNATATSLNKNRELSIQVIAAPIVAAVEKTFTGDYQSAPAWKAAA